MATDGEVNIALKITAQNDGVNKVKQGLSSVESATRKTTASARSGFESMQQSVGKIQSAFGALRNIITGFSIGAIVSTMTAGITKIVESFSAAGKSAEDFFAIQKKLAQEKGIASLVNEYAKLSDAINKAAEAENHTLEMIDIEVENRRKLKDAKIDAAKLDEIEALNSHDEDYAEKLDRIEKKYAAIKAGEAASNAREDIILKRQKMNALADQTYEQANAQNAASAAIRARIAQAQREKSASDIAAASLNEADKTTVASAIGKTAGQLFTGDWGRMADAKTAEGDAIRKAAAEKSAELEKQIQALTEELRKSNEAAAKLRNRAANTRDKADAMSRAIEAAELAGDNSSRASDRAVTAASNAIGDKQAKRNEEAQTFADAQRAQALLSQQKAETQVRIQEHQAAKAAAGYRLYQAQGNYDQAVLSGNQRAQQSSYGALHTAQIEAQNVNHAADQAINALTETLNHIEARLKATQSYLERQSKQQSNLWAETPAGS